jgi:aerobic-type carbon monoxide dehydrogenase small subunit (CoxS/CutS family)
MAKSTSTNLSRRDFFKRFSGQHRSDFLKVTPYSYTPKPADSPERRGPGPVLVKLRVNGDFHELQVEPQTTLLEVLRGPLGLTGVKQGCDRGECGACTVLMNNQPVCSCHLLAIEVDDADILTIEGLSTGDTLHKVQEAFIRHDALGCGFCTPAHILCVKALLDKDPYPTEQKVRDAVAGVTCSCGVQQRVVAAAKDPAPVMTGLSSIQFEDQNSDNEPITGDPPQADDTDIVIEE